MKRQHLTGILTAALLLLCTNPAAAESGGDGNGTTFDFPYLESTEVHDEVLGWVESTTMADDVGIAIPPELQCGPLTLWFDGECRDRAWLEPRVAGTSSSTHIVGTQYRGGVGAVIVSEQVSSNTFVRTLVTDAWSASSLAPGTASGYPIAARMRQELLDQGDSTYVVLTEYLAPSFNLSQPNTLEVMDWNSVQFSTARSPEYCSMGMPCATNQQPGDLCPMIRVRVPTTGNEDCLGADGFFADVQASPIGSGLGVLAVRSIPGSDSLPGSGTTTVTGADLGGPWVHAGLACDDAAMETTFVQLVDDTCINPPGNAPGVPTRLDDDDEPVGCWRCAQVMMETGQVWVDDGWFPFGETEVIGCEKYEFDADGVPDFFGFCVDD